MSAKFLHAFTEENSELQKQIGCMAGFFQMFDRHNLLAGRRFKGRHNYNPNNNNKRITSGNSSVNVTNPGSNNVVCSPQLVLERNISENQRMSLESSRTSFSSSTSSSFSSIDCNKSTLHGPSSFNQAAFHDKSVKEEARALSVKTSHKEDDFKQPALRYIDSPRPIQLPKSVDGSYVIGGIDSSNSRPPLDLNESLRVLMKLKETPWAVEAKEAGLNRRLSYDGREISPGFLDSRDNGKPSSKLKELPRLSLDSRESSMRSSSSIMKDLDRSRSSKEGNFTSSNGQKEVGNKKGAPGVVARLMGLEVMPPLCSNHEEKVVIMKNCPLNTSIKHGVKSPVVISKPYFTAKTTIEPAPWKKEKLHVARNTSKQQPETIYSEIEKRLNDLEFHYANKDLRALKQILDAIQAKELVESKKNEQQHSPKLVATRNDGNLGSPVARKPPVPTSAKGIGAKKAYDPPIVIMKPAKSLNRFDVAATSVIQLHGLSRIQRLRTSEAMDKKKGPCSNKLARDCSPRASPLIKGKAEENGQKSRLRAELGLSRLQQSSRESNEKTSNSVSPRLLQRKLEVESRIRSSAPSSDSRKHQNLSTNKQTSESVSPRNKLRRRPTTSQQGGDMNSASQLNMEVALAKNSISTQKNPPVALDEGPSTVAMVAAEQPSPISVLDATFSPDDLPSAGAKRSTNIPKGNKLPNSDNFYESHKIDSEINQKKLESIGNLLLKLEELNSSAETTSTTDHIASLCETHDPNHRYISEILLASGLLMEDLSSAPVGLMPIQWHPTEHPINPDLFLVLEQTKSSQASNSENINGNTLPRRHFDTEKLHRKLVFDVVNEVLVQKLELTCFSSHSMLLPARKLHDRLPSGQQLLKQLCSEIDQLQAEALDGEDPDDDDDDDDNITAEEILRQLPSDWNDHRRELGAIVLDIERSIFKDMIDEVVCVEACSLKHKSCRRRRQLFAK